MFGLVGIPGRGGGLAALGRIISVPTPWARTVAVVVHSKAIASTTLSDVQPMMQLLVLAPFVSGPF